MKIIHTSISILIFLVGCLCSFAEDSLPKWHGDVCLRFSGSELPEAESYFRRELRGINDINLTEDKSSADFVVSIVAIKSLSQSQQPIGFDFSVCVYQPFQTNILSDTNFFSISKKISPDEFNTLQAAVSGQCRIVKQALLNCGPNELKTEIEQIVAMVDTDCFEPTRQQWDFIQKLSHKISQTNTNVPWQGFGK